MMRILMSDQAQVTAEKLAFVSLMTSISVAIVTYVVMVVFTHG